MKLLLTVLVAWGLFFANPAAADTIIDLTDLQSGTDLSAEIQAMFGTSMFWTTAGNIAEIDALLGISSGAVTDDSQDPDLLYPLLQIVLAEEEASGEVSLDAPAEDALVSDNPEPVTLVLLGGGLILMAAWTVKVYGARQPTHRSGGN
jgi:hypothetical protein